MVLWHNKFNKWTYAGLKATFWSLVFMIGPCVCVHTCTCVCMHMCVCVCPYRVCCMKDLGASDFFHPGLKPFYTAHLPIWWTILTLHIYMSANLIISIQCIYVFLILFEGVLKLHASTPYIYERMLLDMLFTRSELKESLILPSVRRKHLIKKVDLLISKLATLSQLKNKLTVPSLLYRLLVNDFHSSI